MGPLVFLLCLITYLVTLSPGPYPGESARTVIQYSGIDPFAPLANPVYHLVARVAAAFPIGSIAMRLNVLNAVFGALSAWLIYATISRIPRNRTQEESSAHFSAERVQTISGVAAALLFAFSVPVWIVSTRAYVVSLSLLMMMGSVFLTMEFVRGAKLTWLLAASLVWGLTMTQFATAILLTPLFVLAALVCLWHAEQLTLKSVGAVALAGLVGLLPYLLHTIWYCTTPAYEWRAFDSAWQVLKYMLLGQYYMITLGLPKHGWLTILIVTFIPWVIVYFFRLSKRGTRSAWLGSYILNGVLSAIAIGILLNGKLAPWRMTGMNPLLVTPYLFYAMWAGYLTGYWYAVLSNEKRWETELSKVVRRMLRWVYLPAIVALLVFGFVKNAPAANGRSGALCVRFAEEVVQDLQGRKWLVSNGAFDDLIALAARERGVPVHLLSTAYSGGANAYTRYLASLFEDARLKSLARVGVGPLTHEMLSGGTNVADEVAILAVPDLWYAGGYVPVPNKVLYLGAPAGQTPDASAMLAAHEAFWADFGAAAREEVARADSLALLWNAWILTHVGRLANNLGVYLEDAGRDEDAFKAYAEARSLDTNNVSALINMHALAKRESRPEFTALDEALNEYAKRLKSGGRQMWALAYTYGYIRNAEHYASRGWAWAMTGKPNLAAEDMKRALDLSGQQGSSQLALGQMYLAQDKPEESQQAYLEVLQKDPDNVAALMGLMRVAMNKGDLDTARSHLARLEDLKVSPVILKLEKAGIESLAGDYRTAMNLLNQVVQEQPESMKAWAMIAALAAELNDKEAGNKALDKLQAAKALPPEIRMTMAGLALAGGDRKGARRHLGEFLRMRPGDVQALEMLLRLDVFEGQRDLAEQHVERLLTMEPRNALGNYILGTLQVSHEQYALAESSFRISLEAKRTPEVLNDLAWVLARRGAYDEALQLAREAIKVNDKNGAAWDTLGAVLLGQNNLEEAERAFQQALTLLPNRAGIMLNMALLYERKGLDKDALRLADDLMARPTELSREEYESLRQLVRRLRSTT
jgi:tetratricopeptide (TPR) repeat protein